MKHNLKSKPSLRRLLFSALVLAALALPAQGAAESPLAQHVAALKASLAASKAVLKDYEWVQTTRVSIKGEEKSRQMDRCYYGADGGVQKVPLTAPEQPERRRGLRGRIAERKQEEMTEYMKRAVELTKSYVPPNSALLQAAKDQGRVSVDMLDPGKRVRLNFKDYLKPGDTLSAEVDLTKNRLLALSVKSYLDDAKDAVDVKARFATLADGTTYPDEITLDAPAKELQVNVDNSGYRKTQ